MATPSFLRSAAGTALALLSFGAAAQSITPTPVNASIAVGETLTVHSAITLGAAGATNVDVFFLADNTGSMGSTIGKAQSGASAILSSLPSSYRFGVGRYFGDPSEGVSPSTSYSELTALTSNKPAVQSGINNWIASGGGDYPEGGYFALKQVADTAGWRADAQRLVVMFGDAPSHTETTTRAQAVSALEGANAKVIAFNNGSAGGGMDDSYGSDSQQISSLVGAVGGSVTNNFLSVSSGDFVSAVTAQIAAAASSLDLVFGSTFVGGGLAISFDCTDPLGCTDVAAGQTRTFDTLVKGVTAGSYTFDTFAQGIDAKQHFTLNVGAVAAVPEPSTYALMVAGLAMCGLVASRRRSDRDGDA